MKRKLQDAINEFCVKFCKWSIVFSLFITATSIFS